jgi:hypothetical protein
MPIDPSGFKTLTVNRDFSIFLIVFSEMDDHTIAQAAAGVFLCSLQSKCPLSCGKEFAVPPQFTPRLDVNATHCARFYRPQLLLLEDRVPLGDTVLGVVLGSALMEPSAQVLMPAQGPSESIVEWQPAKDEPAEDALLSVLEVDHTHDSLALTLAPSMIRTEELWSQSYAVEGGAANPDTMLSKSIPASWPDWATLAVGTAQIGHASLGLSPQGARDGVSIPTASLTAGRVPDAAYNGIAAPLNAVPANPLADPSQVPVGSMPQSKLPVGSTTATRSQAQGGLVAQNYSQLPLSFEVNQGQFNAQVQFRSRGPGYDLFLTSAEVMMALAGRAADASPPVPFPLRGSVNDARFPSIDTSGVRSEGAVVHMEFLGGNPAAQITGLNRLPGIVNYFLGNDASKWRTHIPTYAQVQYQDVYPGINLVYYGNQQKLEYDFDVAPGADPSQIHVGFTGVQTLSVNASGDLVLQAGAQVLRQHQPIAYQNVAGQRLKVATSFVVQGQQVGFALGRYDRTLPLVIDPVLSYSTYLDGNSSALGDGDYGHGIAVDAAGNAYITGSTEPANRGVWHAFVAKLNATGSALVYSTYFGGSSSDFGDGGIAVDAAGNAYVTGTTYSADFPTVDPLQATYSGGDAFVAKLNATGSALVYSTYLGGSRENDGYGIAVDVAGNAYVTGVTNSPDFPTANPLQPAYGGGLLDAFVAKLNASGSALIYSTSLGGNDEDRGYGIAVDTACDAYVTGFTASADFPTTNYFGPPGGAAFVAKVNDTGSALIYSAILGAAWGFGIALDGCGNAYATGYAYSADFPTVNALQPVFGGFRDAFVAKLNATGSALVYSTYLGGSNDDIGFGIAVDAAGDAFVTGETDSHDFPTTNALQPSSRTMEAFLAKILPGNPSSLRLDQWTAQGPAPILNGQTPGNQRVTGRITAVAPDPTNAGTVYIAAAGGGVWKTTNADAPNPDDLKWIPLTDTQDTLFMGALTLAPSNPNIIYAGTGEANFSYDSYYGRGILKSTDAGATWSLLTGNPGQGEFDRHTVSRIVVDPTNPSIVYAAVAGGGTKWRRWPDRHLEVNGRRNDVGQYHTCPNPELGYRGFHGSGGRSWHLWGYRRSLCSNRIPGRLRRERRLRDNRWRCHVDCCWRLSRRRGRWAHLTGPGSELSELRQGVVCLGGWLESTWKYYAWHVVRHAKKYGRRDNLEWLGWGSQLFRRRPYKPQQSWPGLVRYDPGS